VPRRARLALIAAAIAGGIAAAGGGGPAAGVGVGAPPPRAEGAAHRASLPWPRDGGLTGLSAIEIGDGGEAFVALSDRGRIATGRIRRDGDGRPRAIELGRVEPLAGPGGAPLPPRRRDAEGLAIGPEGRLYVSFEGPARIWAYAGPGAPAEPLPAPSAFARLPLNEGFEALAIDRLGRLLAVPEVREDAAGIPVWRLEGGAWRIAFRLAPSPEFRPVAADVGPDERFYLLERALRPPFGFRTRLRRFDLPGDAGGTVLIDTATGTHGNLEGLSVWRDGQGRLVASMVSDDNENRLLRAELVEYLLPD
jgi:hypothetical protein